MITLSHGFKIKNDEDGRAFLRVLRGMGHKLKLRGRGHRHGVNRYRQDLPLDKATSIAVYSR